MPKLCYKPNKTNNKSQTDFISIFMSIMIFVIMLLILLDPTTYAKSIINGLSLYFTNVLPGLLPFMFLVKELTNQNVITKLTKPFGKITKSLFGVSENGFYCFIMSLISGYPIGAKIASDLYSQNQLSDYELLKASIFSSTPGLIFVIGSVGGLMLNNVKLGIYIYLLTIFSCILTSIIINMFFKNKTHAFNKNNQFEFQKQKLGIITSDTTSSLLSVGFYIALFSLIIDLFLNLKVFYFLSSLIGINSENMALSQSVMSGIVEMTNGVKKLSKNITPISLSFISSIISFSGFSIIMQSLSFLSSTNIKPIFFILGKLLQSIICFILSLLFFNFVI